MDIIKYLPDRQKQVVLNSGETLVSVNQKFKCLYYIHSGALEIIKEEMGNLNYLLWIAGPKDMLGILPFFGNGIYEYKAMALSDCTLSIIEKEEFQVLINSNPAVKKSVFRILNQRINYMENRLASFMSKNTKQRLAETLLYLCKMLNKSKTGATKFNVEYPMERLPGIIGTTSWYLDKLLRDFQKEGIIDRKRNFLIVLSLSKLSELCNPSIIT